MSRESEVEIATPTDSGYFDYSIEFGHMYYDEFRDGRFSLLEPAIETVLMLIRALTAKGASVSLCLMIDDYTENQEITDRDVTKLRAYLSANCLDLHHVAFEADLAAVAPVMLNMVRSKWLRKDGTVFYLRSQNLDKHLDHSVQIGHRPKSLLLGTAGNRTYFEQERAKSQTEVTLAETQGADVRYGCALLATCWALARLGISPFCKSLKLDSIENAPPFFGRNLITVLPTDYLKTEATVVELLKASRNIQVRKSMRKIQYFFHRPSE
jgi:hypothetical protein